MYIYAYTSIRLYTIIRPYDHTAMPPLSFSLESQRRPPFRPRRNLHLPIGSPGSSTSGSHHAANYSTLLAAQRTLLSYVRTAISVSAIGHSYGAPLGWVTAIAVVLFATGAFQYALSSVHLIRTEPLDASTQTGLQVAALVVSVAAIVVAAYVVASVHETNGGTVGVSGALGTL